ncbi:GNAT family N-acetyltransferase [Bacillus sp. FJAT-27445]|uniref:GNAT family N-acetyltransferase n=1 Tax=Bacillus sp. FJAT-27445 TaxID=1679166 RepID=UPI0007443DFE|nr:GNAT family N-acetyltransferase [Bacillus sp. FJAT-27445]
MDIEMKRPVSSDNEELLRFFRTVITDTYEKEGISGKVDDLEEEIKTKEAYLKKDLETGGKERYFLIAKIGGNIIGSIEFGPASSIIQECTLSELKGFMEVGTVFVHPDFQRRGIGNSLLEAIFFAMKSRGIETCCLDSGYKNAQQIWKKKFGEPDYLLKDYWGEGFDHMIWRIRI